MFESKLIKIINQNPNSESCGFITIKHFVNSAPIFEIFPSENLAEYSYNQFEISIDHFNFVSKTKKIFCIYHSHVIPNSNENFSKEDIFLSETYKIPILVYSTETKKFNWYKPFSAIENFKNRPFLIGINDCFALVRDYYYKELSIELLDFYRSTNPFLSIDLQKIIRKNNFIAIKLQDIKKHDVIIIKDETPIFEYSSILYLGNNKVYTHLNGNPKIEKFEKYKTKIHSILRHSSNV